MATGARLLAALQYLATRPRKRAQLVLGRRQERQVDLAAAATGARPIGGAIGAVVGGLIGWFAGGDSSEDDDGWTDDEVERAIEGETWCRESEDEEWGSC
jgi:hypothetical protein